jgi:hypothetical protein
MATTVVSPALYLSDIKQLVSIGRLAGGVSISGVSNVIVGAGAGSSITTGSHNVIIGYNANAPATYSYNTVIGATATATGTASGSVILGYGATSNLSGACIFGGPPSGAAAVAVQDSGPRIFVTLNAFVDCTGLSTYNMSAAELFDGVCLFYNNDSGSGTTIRLPTASAILAQLPNPIVNAMFYSKITNDYSSSENLWILGSTDSPQSTTYYGAPRMVSGQSGNVIVIVTQLSPARVVVYN